MNWILIWIAVVWALAMVLTIGLTGMSSRQDRVARDEQAAVTARLRK